MRRTLKIGALSVAGVLVAVVLGWVVCGFAVDSEFGVSRLVYAWHDGRIAQFHRLFIGIEAGMDRTAVLATVRRVYPEDGRRVPPTIRTISSKELVIFMSPESSSEPNCEAIVLSLKDDRVSRKRYSID